MCSSGDVHIRCDSAHSNLVWLNSRALRHRSPVFEYSLEIHHSSSPLDSSEVVNQNLVHQTLASECDLSKERLCN
jgi:hypothetical protein